MSTQLLVLAVFQNRLALGIVRAYTLLHPQATLADLRAVFPHSLHSNSGVGQIIADATQVNNLQGPNWKGYFNKPDEIIHLADSTQVAVTSMWPLPDLRYLMDIAASQGIAAQLTGTLPPQGQLTLPDGKTITPNHTQKYRLLMPSATEVIGTADPLAGRLLQDVVADIHRFFKLGHRLFYNERDLQVCLGGWLQQLRLADGVKKYDDIYFEYYVPASLFGSNPWGNKMRMNIDIVAERGGEYLPIELKYATKAVKNFDPGTFGVSYNDVKVIKTQGAQNLIRYNYWKDVRRLELVSQLFANVHNGIALFLTNDPAYQRQLTSGAVDYHFSTCKGAHGTDKSWATEISKAISRTHPSFTLSSPYTIDWCSALMLWRGTPVDETTFLYSLIQV